MINHLPLSFPLLVFCALTTNAQFTVGSGEFTVKAGSQVMISGLTLSPSADFTLTSQSLSISNTPVSGNPASIARVYRFSHPVDFAGNLGLYYLTSELNGNDESTLQLAHGNQTFVTTTGSTVDLASNFVFNSISTLTSLTSVTAAQEGALPVTLVYFQLRRVEKAAMLNWQTTDERNSDFFEIQHSSDARRWTRIGQVSAAGESKSLREYSFKDNVLRTGWQYYRLRMVDADVSYAYSAIQSIRMDGAPVITAYPNPVTDHLFVTTNSKGSRVRLLDLSGRVLSDSHNNTAEPMLQFNMKHYPSGTYLIEAKSTDGTSQVIKVIKQ